MVILHIPLSHTLWAALAPVGIALLYLISYVLLLATIGAIAILSRGIKVAIAATYGAIWAWLAKAANQLELETRRAEMDRPQRRGADLITPRGLEARRTEEGRWRADDWDRALLEEEEERDLEDLRWARWWRYRLQRRRQEAYWAASEPGQDLQDLQKYSQGPRRIHSMPTLCLGDFLADEYECELCSQISIDLQSPGKKYKICAAELRETAKFCKLYKMILSSIDLNSCQESQDMSEIYIFMEPLYLSIETEPSETRVTSLSRLLVNLGM